MVAQSKVMLEVIGKHAESNDVVEIKDIMNKFNMDTMGSSTFGFEINTLTGQNEDMPKMVLNLTKMSWFNLLEYIVNRKLLQLLRVKTYIPEFQDYFKSLIYNNREYREKNNIKRNDIFQLVQQMTDHTIKDEELVKDKKLSSVQMVLALQSFFLGSFESTSIATMFALYELSLNPDIQQKLRENIRECLSTNEEFSYSAIMQMEYLDCVLNGKFQIIHFIIFP